jgi:arylamine N-acetyltransferase
MSQAETTMDRLRRIRLAHLRIHDFYNLDVLLGMRITEEAVRDRV